MPAKRAKYKSFNFCNFFDLFATIRRSSTVFVDVVAVVVVVVVVAVAAGMPKLKCRNRLN